jgi:glycosyltransferase involved in cell wall biosynthesis
MPKKVIVIIPTYNCAKYLQETIGSVLKQTYQDFEIIVVDDGSTDNTKEILNPYIKNRNIRYFYQENKGPAAARNRGIQESQGEYIAFLDADDVWHPLKIDLQMKYLSQNPDVFALSTTMAPYGSNDSRLLELCNYEVKSYSFEEMLIRARMCTPTMVIRRDALAKSGGFREDLRLCEDHELWLRLGRFGNLHKMILPLVYYRTRADGLSAGNRDRTVREYFKFINELFKKQYPEYRKQYLRKTISVYYFHVSIEYTEIEKYYKAIKYLMLSIMYCPFGFPEKSKYRLRRLRRFLAVCKIFLNRKFYKSNNEKKRRFKIAIVSSGLGHVTRGVEGWAEEIAYGLKDRGLNVRLYKGGGENKSEIESVIPCIRRDSRLNKRILSFMPSFSWRFGFGSNYQIEEMTFTLNLISRLIKGRFDIIHLKDPDIARTLDWANKCGLIKTKVILAHGTEEPYGFIKKFNFVQHLAPYHLQEARECGVNGRGQFVIPNFVDINKFKPCYNSGLREELNIPKDAFVILSVAAIKKHHKRIDYFLKEMASLKEQFKEKIYVIIAGSETNETTALIKMGKEMLDRQVVFLLNKPKEKMPEIYSAADVFTLCSLKEMMPNALLEAIASGVPAICHRYPVHEWIIGDGGVCIDMTREGELAETVENFFDDNYRNEISKRTRQQAVDNFSKEKIINQTIEMYEAVLNGK